MFSYIGARLQESRLYIVLDLYYVFLYRSFWGPTPSRGVASRESKFCDLCLTKILTPYWWRARQYQPGIGQLVYSSSVNNPFMLFTIPILWVKRLHQQVNWSIDQSIKMISAFEWRDFIDWSINRLIYHCQFAVWATWKDYLLKMSK